MSSNWTSYSHSMDFMYERPTGNFIAVDRNGWWIAPPRWAVLSLETNYTLMADEEMQIQFALGSLPRGDLFANISTVRVWVKNS